MNLQPNTLLQGGKYRIEKVLGQGGFGITYLGLQTGLERKVTIKEFFMKEYCNRNEATSDVSIGSQGSYELVERFRAKFIKEARLIAAIDNPHIVRIHDIFEENETAYYVMEYIDGGSLKNLVTQQGALTENEALGYIRQAAEALNYIHSQKILHLDIKPANILLRHGKEIVLIDFGISKRYDKDGGQTSTTPIGISKGYAPMEQYSGVDNFTPCTDIYSLGATLYYLLTGLVPPEANEVNDNGLPALPATISSTTRQVIEQAMQPRRKDRPQTIQEFLELLKNTNHEVDDTTIVIEEEENIISPCIYGPPPPMDNSNPPINIAPIINNTPKRHILKKIVVTIGIILLIWIVWCFTTGPIRNHPNRETSSVPEQAETLSNQLEPGFLTDYSKLKIGDYYYTDSTFSHILYDTKICAGVVFSLITTGNEKERGWTHGQIVALSNADGNKPHTWGTMFQDLPDPHTNKDIEQAYYDKNGYTYSYSLFTDKLEAFQAARSYPVNLPHKEDSRFSRTSGWYLPSTGQWKDIIQNLGKVTMKSDGIFDAETAARNLKKYGFTRSSYWTSVENDKAEAFYISLLSGQIATNDKRNTFLVRAVAAF